jgi:hypothetical protein
VARRSRIGSSGFMPVSRLIFCGPDPLAPLRRRWCAVARRLPDRARWHLAPDPPHFHPVRLCHRGNAPWGRGVSTVGGDRGGTDKLAPIRSRESPVQTRRQPTEELHARGIYILRHRHSRFCQIPDAPRLGSGTVECFAGPARRLCHHREPSPARMPIQPFFRP